uniref:Synaptobrevin, longin-like domain protein n=1 Tax=Tanacetum cinerariifolium TaxID=118510 RepID=A0A6L2MLR1_TANCI|nr:hypothetical protein [Tanacetum cinerariifolium]
MVSILEKTEHNTDFHQIVDFLEASHIRRHLKLNDEEGISSLPDAELFENLSLMGYNILPNQMFTFQKGQFSHQWKFLIHTIMQCLSPKTKIKDQDMEISELKAQVKSLEDKERRREKPTQKDAPITGGIKDIWEELGADKSTELERNDTKEMVNVISLIEAANILSSRGAAASVSPADVFLTVGVPTVSGSVPTVSVIFTTASVVTPYTRRSRGITIRSSQLMRILIIRIKDKGKEKVIKTEVPKKRKLQEQIDAQVAREMEEEFARENQRLSEQLARDSEIARLHAKEELKIMIEGLDRSNELVPLEEVYIEALQVKHPIIDWEIHSEGKREYWKIIRLGGHTAAIRDKEKELWVELKRLFEPDFEDQLWTHHQAFMHDPLDWKLYDTCGVHHVSTKDQKIFMLVEKDYPLRKGLATMMTRNLNGDAASSLGRIVGNKMLQDIPTASYDDLTASTLCHC